MMSDGREEPLAPIDHSRVIDSRDQLRGFSNYLPFGTFCGICDVKCQVTPKMQKYMLEVVRVPVSSLRRGAVSCEPCRDRRARIKALRRNDQWRQEPDGASEMKRLEAEERTARKNSRASYREGEWPYRHG